jgi:hypothetical protein
MKDMRQNSIKKKGFLEARKGNQMRKNYLPILQIQELNQDRDFYSMTLILIILKAIRILRLT